MSNPEKNPEAFYTGANPNYPPPPPPPAGNPNYGPGDNPGNPPPPPVASGGLLSEQRSELEAPVPPPPSQQAGTDRIHDTHVTGAAFPHDNTANLEFRPASGAPLNNQTNLGFPPPPVEEVGGGEKIPPPAGPHPAFADTTAAAGYSSAAAHPETGAGAAVVADSSQPHKKTWGQRFSQIGQKAAAKLGSPGFLPQPLDKECEKTAQILKAFCKNGVYADPSASSDLPTSTDPNASVTEPGREGAVIDPTRQKPKGRTLVTIPPRVISRAVGLAIFTTLRAGFQVTGALGSGLLVARLPDGSWSPPSAIQVLSVGGGFQFGVDVYDCVCVINTHEALSAFMNTRVSIGGDMAVSAGPYGAGGAVEVGSTMNSKDEEERRRRKKERETAAAIPPQPVPSGAAGDPSAPVPPSTKTGLGGPPTFDAPPTQDASLLAPERPTGKTRRSSSSGFKPVFSYVKSRGFYAGVQVDGTVIVERKEANAAFYGAPIRVEQILHGEVPATQGGLWQASARVLHDVLRGAEAGDLQRQATTGSVGAPVGAPVDRAAPAAAGPSSAAAPGPSSVPVAGVSSAPQAPRYDKAAEARADAEPPAYEEAPPAYVEDHVPRPGVGDQKHA